MASETKHMNTLKAGEKGEVKIADDVVSVIAGLAASDVKGVASLAGNATREVIGKMGFKSLNKGIRLTVDDTQVHVWMKVNIRYGYNVPDTCAAVQDRVVTAIETMTGLTVAEVNVRVNSVVMDGAGTGAAD
ncbi:MAG: Asp23/Gls24 family envelope stress response protein [Lachnospiraceae bacterium]|nr:Asp23/Gls24 family envelope stress response protein [Lachnospiraceae bacterium]